jgi:ABC-2 type transport system ATP-binding protein/capsular polysaccharide transport system ATP-binding protein
MSVSWPLAFGGAFQNSLTGLDNVRFISRIYNQDYRQNIDFVSEFTELGIYLRELSILFARHARPIGFRHFHDY